MAGAWRIVVVMLGLCVGIIRSAPVPDNGTSPSPNPNTTDEDSAGLSSSWQLPVSIPELMSNRTPTTLTPAETSPSRPTKRRKASRPTNWTTKSTTPISSTQEALGDPEETDDIELALPNLFHQAPLVIEYNYLVVIDAGSSHTDLMIYKWPTTKLNGTGLVQQENHLVCQAPLSSFRNNPELAGSSMKDCLNFAALQIPRSQWNITKVLLGATAGMRVLSSQNASLADLILSSVKDYIRDNYEFIVDDKEIIILSPQLEGGFSWISINYIKKTFQENAYRDETSRMETYGSLDLGGASTQFTSEITPTTTKKIRPSFTITLFGHQYKVYTRSYLCYGKNEAYRRYKAVLLKERNFTEPIMDPCRPVGFQINVVTTEHFQQTCSNASVPDHHSDKAHYSIMGTGNGEECRSLVRHLFQKNMDLTPSQCPFQDGECTFRGIEKGKVKGKFLATGSLYYDARNLQSISNGSFSLDPFDMAGFRQARNDICGKSHTEMEGIIGDRPGLKKFFLRQCFDATYFEVLLGEVYNLSDEVLRNTTFAKKIEGMDVGWTLGWAVAATSDLERAGYVKHQYDRR